MGAGCPLADEGKMLWNTMPSLGKENFGVFIFQCLKRRVKVLERGLFILFSLRWRQWQLPPTPLSPEAGGSLIFNDVMIIAKDKKRKISLFVVTTGKSGKLTVGGGGEGRGRSYKFEILQGPLVGLPCYPHPLDLT